MSAKEYKDQNVYDASIERINYVFDEFKNIYVSFSSGKDSGALLSMCIDVARQRKRKFYAVFIDLEAFYQKSIEYVYKMFNENQDVLIPIWICLPMTSPNSLSFKNPTWIWWQKGAENIWIREMPKNKWVINTKNNIFNFYKENMPFEEFIKSIGDSLFNHEKNACLVGIRTDESLNRFRAIKTNKSMYNNKIYSTKISESTYNFYPIYDWKVEDIWTYYGKFNKPYNPIYDLMYLAGISIHKMRIDEPFGNEAKAGLNLFKIIEPRIWIKLVNRVSGANFGNIYSNTKIMNANYSLPRGHTWKSFTEFLLDTLPTNVANHYRDRFEKFQRFWIDVGCPVDDKDIKVLEEKYKSDIINTRSYSNRGNGDKFVIKFKHTMDELPEIEGHSDFPTWRRMAMCIIKNDFLCKSLSFSLTKDFLEKRKNALEKYKSL